jgi:hypothetical protein
MFGAMLAVVEAVWPVIQSVIETANGIIRGAIERLAGPINVVRDAFGVLLLVGTVVWNTLKWIVGSAIDFMIDRINDLKAIASDAMGPIGKIVGAIGSAGGAAARFAGFDDGGVVPGPIGAPTLVLAHGGETILPTHRFPSTPLGDLAASSSSSGGDVFELHLHVDAGVTDPRFFEDRAVEMVRVAQRELERQRRAEGDSTRGVAA